MIGLAAAIHDAGRRALATGALQPIDTATSSIEDDGVRFVVRAVSSLARKAGTSRAAVADPLGDYEPDLFVTDLPPSHYVLLNKFPVVADHVLVVTRRFERQERLLSVDDFAALIACLRDIDGLGFYNGGAQAGASQGRKHLQLVPLPLVQEDGDTIPMEALLGSRHAPPFRHAFARTAARADAAELHAVYRALLERCGIAVHADAGGGLEGAAYNLLVRRAWMLVVPRTRACFETISVNALGFAGSLFVRSRDDLERVRAVGPMRVLRAVTEVPTR